jgi:primary-amine oxidase
MYDKNEDWCLDLCLHAADTQLDMSGTDPTQYHIMAFVHNSKVYRTASELRGAYDRGELKRQKEWDGTDWATRARRGKPRDLDDRAGPRSIQADGARFRVDKDEDYLTWMGWSVYLSFARDMGLHLWDMRFRGERVIYELSPQEAMAQYSGSDPHQASTVWLDRAFGMGGNVREVILGYDCPHHALLLNATVHEMGTTTRQNAICVYERQAERPLSRHTGKEHNEMGAVKGYELVVRSISTVGNYDYIFDYVFQLDGSIEIRVSASGYLQGGVWDDDQAPYGHKLRPNTMGSLHDHVINYKIDFDVAGTENSLMKVSMKQETRDDEWFGLDGWGPVKQSRLVRELVIEEALLEFPKK